MILFINRFCDTCQDKFCAVVEKTSYRTCNPPTFRDCEKFQNKLFKILNSCESLTNSWFYLQIGEYNVDNLKLIWHHNKDCKTHPKEKKLSIWFSIKNSLFDLSHNTQLYTLLRSIWPKQCPKTRTTDAQRGNSLHCTAENSIPIPNF